jgi:filamentous hemagglutinin family protein
MMGASCIRSRKCTENRLLMLEGIALAVAACFGVGAVQANPTNPVVANGAASFAQTGNLLQITNTPNTIINWGSFSIGANEITRFIQQSGASAVLNRVGAGRDPSSILGALQSNGRVFLINPNGITFGAGSQINVAGLVASTLNMSDGDFLAGRMRFTDGLGNSVINNGNITTGTGGNVYLVGNAVTNNGIITSPKGDVILAAGNSVELVNPGTPDLRVEITAPENQAVNLGEIVANSGRVGIYAGLINHSGTVNANSVDVDAAGNITLRATKNIDLAATSRTTANGPTGGNITVQSGDTTLVAGTIEAKGSAGQGGQVNVLGNLVGLTGNASIDASGETGGGTVLIGGDYQGKNTNIQNAFRTYVGADATIKADAIASGDGGKVIVWSDDATRVYGSISARGGALSGNGGLIETSGHFLDVGGIKVDASAVNGSGGMWLLDPYNIEVIAGNGLTNIGGAPTFTPGGSNSQVGADLIATQLNGNTNVTLDTTGAGADAGNININAAINSTGTALLTLKAHNDINLNSPITGNGLSLTLTPNQDSAGGGVANIGSNIAIGGPIIVNGRVLFSGGTPTISASSFTSSLLEMTGGVVTLNTNTTTNTFDMSGGTLTGSGNFTFGGFGTGSVSWSGGTIGGTGTLATGGDGDPDISGPVVLQRNWNPINGFSIMGATGSLNIDGATVTLGGDINITSTAAQQIFGSGNLVNNGSTISLNVGNVTIASAGFSNAAGSTVNFPLNSTLTITGGGTDAANYTFGTGGGTLIFAGGTRSFTGGGVTGGGTLTVSGGSVTMPSGTTLGGVNTLNVSGGALTVDSSAPRSFGSASFSGGTATFNGSQINFPGTFNVSGGVLTGTSNFVTSSLSNFQWSGGTIAGAGTLTTDLGTNNVSGPVTLSRNWTNNPGTTTTLSGTGSININAPAVLTNSGSFSITSTSGTPITGSGTFSNLGTVSEAVANNLSIQSVFNNLGTLSIGGGGVTSLGASTVNDTATYLLSTGNTLAFTGDRTFVGGGVSSSGTSLGDVIFQGGTVTFSGGTTYNPNGKTTVAGGTALFNNGSTTFVGGLDLTSGTLGGSANLIVSGAGAFNWSGGTLGSGGTLTTNGASTLSGSTTLTRSWTAANAIDITSSGTLNLNGSSVTTPTLNVAGLLKGIGTITGNVSNTGTVAPGASPGSINIVGNYTQSPTGTLQIELGGTTPGSSFDQLTVSGNAALNGALVVTQFGSFVATPADTFSIITTGGTVSGAFSSVVVPAVFTGLGAGYQSQLVQLSGAIGPVTAASSIVAVDPNIVREDKDIFAQTNEDTDIFEKLQDYQTCN